MNPYPIYTSSNFSGVNPSLSLTCNSDVLHDTYFDINKMVEILVIIYVIFVGY